MDPPKRPKGWNAFGKIKSAYKRATWQTAKSTFAKTTRSGRNFWSRWEKSFFQRSSHPSRKSSEKVCVCTKSLEVRKEINERVGMSPRKCFQFLSRPVFILQVHGWSKKNLAEKMNVNLAIIFILFGVFTMTQFVAFSGGAPVEGSQTTSTSKRRLWNFVFSHSCIAIEFLHLLYFNMCGFFLQTSKGGF